MKVLVIAARTDKSETALFRALSDKGIDLEVMYDPNVPAYQALDTKSLKTTPIEFRNRVDLKSIKIIKEKLKTGKFDIVHSLINRALSNSLFASRGLNVKHVAYRGTMGHISRIDPSAWITYLNPRVDRIICVSDAVRGYLRGKGLSPDKLATIHKGHNTDWYDSIKPLGRKELGIPDKAILVGYAGGLRPVKGVETLIKAAFQIPDGANIHFVLVGNGSEEEKLMRLAKSEQRIEKVIHFTGFRDDAPAIIAACDIFVMPSVEREGFPRAVIEAMVQRIPIIVSDVGGMPEMIENQNQGLVIPPKDPHALAKAITALAGDKDLRKVMGESARKKVKDKFSIDQTIEKTLSLYEDLLR